MVPAVLGLILGTLGVLIRMGTLSLPNGLPGWLDVPFASGLLLGGGGALIAAAAWRFVRARADEGVGSGLAHSITPAPLGTSSVCPRCRRPLLPGTPECPFCNPVVPPPEDPLEKTTHEDYRPLVEPVAMPGLTAAAQLKRDSGAKARGYLHVFEGISKGASLLLLDQTIRVGRSPDCTLILKDSGVSTEHAEIRPDGKSYRIKDLASKNGTFVNDMRVDEKVLQSGDVVAFGATKILVHLS